MVVKLALSTSSTGTSPATRSSARAPAASIRSVTASVRSIAVPDGISSVALTTSASISGKNSVVIQPAGIIAIIRIRNAVAADNTRYGMSTANFSIRSSGPSMNFCNRVSKPRCTFSNPAITRFVECAPAAGRWLR